MHRKPAINLLMHLHRLTEGFPVDERKTKAVISSPQLAATAAEAHASSPIPPCQFRADLFLNDIGLIISE